MFLGSYRFDGDPAELLPAYRRVLAAIPDGDILLHVCIRDSNGLTVFDACPSEHDFEHFSHSPDVLGLFQSSGLPRPTVTKLGEIEHAVSQAVPPARPTPP